MEKRGEQKTRREVKRETNVSKRGPTNCAGKPNQGGGGPTGRTTKKKSWVGKRN